MSSSFVVLRFFIILFTSLGLVFVKVKGGIDELLLSGMTLEAID